MLDGVTREMRQFAGDPSMVADLRYQRLDASFHLAILQAAASPMLLEAYRATVNWRFSALRTRLARQRQHAQNSLREHLEIRDAVVRDDPADLQARLRGHIDHTDRYYAHLLRERAVQTEPAV